MNGADYALIAFLAGAAIMVFLLNCIVEKRYNSEYKGFLETYEKEDLTVPEIAETLAEASVELRRLGLSKSYVENSVLSMIKRGHLYRQEALEEHARLEEPM